LVKRTDTFCPKGAFNSTNNAAVKHGSTLIFHSGSTKPYSLTQKYGSAFTAAAREWFSLGKAEKGFQPRPFLSKLLLGSYCLRQSF